MRNYVIALVAVTLLLQVKGGWFLSWTRRCHLCIEALIQSFKVFILHGFSLVVCGGGETG